MKRLVLALALTLTPAQGKSETVTIRSSAGATARVAKSAASAFQSYIAALEKSGARILSLGGIRRGRCSIPRHKHPCGLALDVCQLSRGRVDDRCKLPPRSQAVAMAARTGLIEGGSWCNSDYGHVEVRTPGSADSCSKHPLLGKKKVLEEIRASSLPFPEAQP